ncbi:MAG: carbohydrate kinase family protein [Candidatus Pacebacteria bacterium]|nr:carbohydrate kinase family protein [Candidatus Paceibacterota bacterium]
MSEFEFIAIGDITTDEFIQLRADRAVVNTTLSGRKTISMYFGDKLEYEGAVNVPAVGNSANAAVGGHRLGLKSALVADIGDDIGGVEIMDWLKKEGVDTCFIDVQKNKETNHHYVLRYGPERTILIKHEVYEYVVPDMGTPKWLYFSSVGEHAVEYHHDIARYVQSHPGTKLAFQPGSFQIQLGHECLRDVYEACELFFCNKEEAQQILATDEKDIPTLLHRMKDLGPTIPVITDGPAGAYALANDGVWHMPMYPDPAPPVDRTGAGDAFSSTFTAALALGHDIPTALRWGPINSMSVVQYIGAQEGLLSLAQIEEYVAKAPVEYQARKVD